MHRYRASIVFALLTILIIPLLTPSDSVVEAQSAPAATSKVLVTYTQAPGASAATARSDAEWAVGSVLGKVTHSYESFALLAAEVPANSLGSLANSPYIARVEPDGIVKATDLELDNSWGVQRIGAGLVHAYNKGTGVKVAIVDTGVDMSHFELDGNFVGGFDFVNGDSDPFDDNGHGTHVAGTVCAEDNESGVVGVAPECALYAYKVLASDGFGLWSDIVAAMDRAIIDDIDVVNMSLGGSSAPAAVRDAMIAATDAGILIVASAGNEGFGGAGSTVGFPGVFPEVIAVAATTQSDGRASFSSTGPEVELAAPGFGITSSVPGGGFASFSGDSPPSQGHRWPLLMSQDLERSSLRRVFRMRMATAG